MPIYDYSCDDHGNFRELHPLAANPPKRPCPECGKPCKKMIVAPSVKIFEAYYDRGLGEYVESESERQQICKARDITPTG